MLDGEDNDITCVLYIIYLWKLLGVHRHIHVVLDLFYGRPAHDNGIPVLSAQGRVVVHPPERRLRKRGSMILADALYTCGRTQTEPNRTERNRIGQAASEKAAHAGQTDHGLPYIIYSIPDLHHGARSAIGVSLFAIEGNCFWRMALLNPFRTAVPFWGQTIQF